MKKLDQFLNKYAYGSSICLFIIALLIDIAAFTGTVIYNGFTSTSLVTLLFEVILHVLLIIFLIKRNPKASQLFMILIKVVDAVIFSIFIANKIDQMAKSPAPTHYISYINFTSYCVSTILLLLILVFCCLHYLNGKHVYWKIVKILLLLTALVMLVASAFEIINLIKYSSYWFVFLEPFYMVFLMLGMFVVCQYIEKGE